METNRPSVGMLSLFRSFGVCEALRRHDHLIHCQCTTFKAVWLLGMPKVACEAAPGRQVDGAVLNFALFAPRNTSTSHLDLVWAEAWAGISPTCRFSTSSMLGR